jgi:CxxC-x17-CxxC domain-containing protein
MSYQDRTLTCLDCNQSFTFSADDQRYHAEKGYNNEPKRCTSCRQARRNSGGGSSSYGSSYGSGGYSSGYGSSSYGSSGYGSSGGYSSRREMHDVVCAQCGKNTQVPFRPSGGRPVYCSDCFSKQPTSSSRRY